MDCEAESRGGNLSRHFWPAGKPNYRGISRTSESGDTGISLIRFPPGNVTPANARVAPPGQQHPYGASVRANPAKLPAFSPTTAPVVLPGKLVKNSDANLLVSVFSTYAFMPNCAVAMKISAQ